jgi:hypothetical protein
MTEFLVNLTKKSTSFNFIFWCNRNWTSLHKGILEMVIDYGKLLEIVIMMTEKPR